MKSSTNLEHALATISNKQYKYVDANGKLNILLNMKLENVDLMQRICKAIYQLYKEDLSGKNTKTNNDPSVPVYLGSVS